MPSTISARTIDWPDDVGSGMMSGVSTMPDDAGSTTSPAIPAGREIALRVQHVCFSYRSPRRIRGRDRAQRRSAGETGGGLRPAVMAVDDVTLDVPAGQSVAVLGPNGSGKSTLMRIICGLQKPDAGEVFIFGSAELTRARQSLGVVFQTESLDPHLTVFENLRDQAALYGLDRQIMARKVDEQLHRWNLHDRRDVSVKTLSQGLKRRVDLLRATLHQPPLLLLDEPTVGLDPAAREQFLRDLETHRREQGLTILMSTHLIDEADRQDRVLLMNAGRLIADDSPNALRAQAGRHVITVMNQQWRPDERMGGLWERTATGWRCLVHSKELASVDVMRQLADTEVPFSVAPPTLGDVFEHHTGKRLEQTVVAA